MAKSSKKGGRFQTGKPHKENAPQEQVTQGPTATATAPSTGTEASPEHLRMAQSRGFRLAMWLFVIGFSLMVLFELASALFKS